MNPPLLGLGCFEQRADTASLTPFRLFATDMFGSAACSFDTGDAMTTED